MAENNNKKDPGLEDVDWWFDIEKDSEDVSSKKKEAEDLFWKHFGGPNNKDNDKAKNVENKEESESKSTENNKDLKEYESLFEKTPENNNNQSTSSSNNSLNDNKSKEIDSATWDVVEDIKKPSIVTSSNNLISDKKTKNNLILNFFKKLFSRKKSNHINNDNSDKKEPINKKLLVSLSLSVIILGITSGYLGYKQFNNNKSCFGSKYVLAQIHTGDSLILNINDENESKQIIENGYTDSNISQLLYQFLKPGETSIEVGSGYGYYTIYMSRIVGSNGKVYSIEADRETCSLLKKSLSINNIKNVYLFNSIIFSTTAEASVANIGETKNLKIKLENRTNNMALETVTSLDTIIPDAKDISVLIINSKGNEANIIYGANKILMNSPKIKIITTWNTNIAKNNINIEDFFYQLSRSGFHIWTVDNKNHRLNQIKNVKDIMDSNVKYLIITRQI
ncbi:FkbM family methyltransferase [Lyticum sinuosum]|uniref:SAM-dependent methyl-transferase n=1 Tax=Lyticum sinuosum TaxID=1332059 RepID=A0AAE4VJE3_9RICK|nr:FkbM family methyltransferase [Lyticum sinuosum]MDZ5761110.1 SAM-dependent methyl-transferase [Lyticum sinuosum]